MTPAGTYGTPMRLDGEALVATARVMLAREHPTLTAALVEAVVDRAIARVWTGDGSTDQPWLDLVRAEATAISRTRPAVAAHQDARDALFDKDRR